MDKYNNTTHGFTLIETLVAITILMIAIAGPLTVANKAYHTALNARDRVVATNLAQEAIEYINYWKNNRNDDKPKNTFKGWDPDSSTVPDAFITCNPESPSCDMSGTPKGFDLKYHFEDRLGGPIDRANNQAIVNVVVTWGDIDSVDRKIDLSTVLTNYHR